MGGGGKSGESTTKTEPWAGQQPYLTDLYGKAKTAQQATPTTPYGGPLLADVTPEQQQANAMRVALAGQNPNLGAGTIQLANDTIAGKYLTPDSNPYFKAGLDATINPMIERVKTEMLPQLSANAYAAGAFGGSGHQGSKERINLDLARAVSETGAKAYSDMYGRERALQVAAPQMLQSGFSLEQLPIELLAGAGDVSRGWDQEKVDEAIARYQMSVEAPWQGIREYGSIIGSGSPGGISTTTANAPRPSKAAGAFSGALGGAATGAMVGGPWGALAGGALGALSGAFF